MHDNGVSTTGYVWRGKRGAGAYSVDTERLRTPLAGFFSILLVACCFPRLHVYAQPEFSARIDVGEIDYPHLTEASGLVASRTNTGVLWTHNDSGDRNRLYALDSHGKFLGAFVVDGVTNRDWEDIAIGPGPHRGHDYLYIADIGDNQARHAEVSVYRIPEPHVDSGRVLPTTRVSGVVALTLYYPDGQRDAETLLVDPLSDSVYVISKREEHVRVYRAAFSHPSDHAAVLDMVGELDIGRGGSSESWAVGGDISASGRDILIKTYTALYYWSRSPDETVSEALRRRPIRLPYVPEPQGEAVCWNAAATGYYTLSEERDGTPARLYFYPRVGSRVGGLRDILLAGSTGE